jgi:hypothetical protein
MGKINFVPELYYYYFLIIGLEEMRESHRNLVLERVYVGNDFGHIRPTLVSNYFI